MIDGVVKGPVRRRKFGGWRRIIIQSGKSITVIYNPFPKRLEPKTLSLSETTLDGQRLLFERLEQKVSLSEASLDGQRLLGNTVRARLDIKFFHVKLN